MNSKGELTEPGEIIAAVEEVVWCADRMRNSFHRFPPKTARERRRFEDRNTFDRVTWYEGTDVYTAAFETVCSARKIYAKGEYTKNGNKTTLTAIKNSLKRLKETFIAGLGG